MNQIIRHAIEQKRTLKFKYDDRLRIVEPHAYGKTTAGNDAIRVYETSGKEPGWSLFLLDKIEKLSMGSSVFPKKRMGYHRKDRGMSEIYCEL